MKKLRNFKTCSGKRENLSWESNVGSRWRESSAIAVVLRRVNA
jgi:hypothetical protein